MTFIEIGNTLFNLTHIRKVRRFRTHDKKLHVVIEYTDGETESLDSEYAYRSFNGLESTRAGTIPAAPGWVVLNCWFQNEPPGLEDIDRQPVIGWQTYKYGPTICSDPITLDDGPTTDDSGCTAILRPDGVVVIPAVQSWSSIEAWLEAVREAWEKWQGNQKIELAGRQVAEQ